MKVRIIDKGFANFTGQFGSVEFVKGVSDDISAAEAARLGAIIQVEDEESGKNPSATQLLVDSHNKNRSEMNLRDGVANKVVQPKKVEKPKTEKVEKPKIEKAELDYSYTEDDLGNLVKKEGIAGLRSFAEAYGVNGRSIVSMVGEMMDLKAQNAPVASPVDSGKAALIDDLYTKAVDAAQGADLTEEEKIAGMKEIEAAANAAAEQE